MSKRERNERLGKICAQLECRSPSVDHLKHRISVAERRLKSQVPASLMETIVRNFGTPLGGYVKQSRRNA